MFNLVQTLIHSYMIIYIREGFYLPKDRLIKLCASSAFLTHVPSTPRIHSNSNLSSLLKSSPFLFTNYSIPQNLPSPSMSGPNIALTISLSPMKLSISGAYWLEFGTLLQIRTYFYEIHSPVSPTVLGYLTISFTYGTPSLAVPATEMA